MEKNIIDDWLEKYGNEEINNNVILDLLVEDFYNKCGSIHRLITDFDSSLFLLLVGAKGL